MVSLRAGLRSTTAWPVVSHCAGGAMLGGGPSRSSGLRSAGMKRLSVAGYRPKAEAELVAQQRATTASTSRPAH